MFCGVFPVFCFVCCDRSILVALVFRILLLCVSKFLGTCNSAGRCTCRLLFCSVVYFLCFFIAHCGWSIHLSLLLCSVVVSPSFFALITCHLCTRAISGRKRATVACSTPVRLFRVLRSLLWDCGNCQSLRRGQKAADRPRRVMSWRTDFTSLRLS